MRLQTAYLHDEAWREARLARDGICWFDYAQDLFERIGAPARRLSPAELRDPAALSEVSFLLLPDLDPGDLDADQLAALHGWVRAGGCLVGSGTADASELFGLETAGRAAPAGDPWRPTGTFEPPAEHAVHRAGEAPTRPIPVFGPLLSAPSAAGGWRHRRLGAGETIWLACDLCRTLWTMHQGRPIDRDYDGDGYLRTPDGIVLPREDWDSLAADRLVGLLRNVLAATGHPVLYPLPALDGAVPDLLCHWGGDDEGIAGADSLAAARFMASRGLPYHVNILPLHGEFRTSPAEFAALRSLGCEPSLHPNFVDGFEHPLRFTRDDLARQVELYRRWYGETPVCTVNHWTLWHGWSEPAEWLAELGVQADNSRFGRQAPPLNPTNTLSYSYGTSYPFWFRNAAGRIDCLSLPITAYEPGYTREPDALDPAVLHTALADAAHLHLTVNLFFHSVCLVQYAGARAAVDAALAYLAEHRLKAVHCGQDRLNRWWRSRTAARIEDVQRDAGRCTFSAECDWPDGFVVSVFVFDPPVAATVDGARVAATPRGPNWIGWLNVPLPPGRHRVTVEPAG